MKVLKKIVMIITSVIMAVTFSSCGLFEVLGLLFGGYFTPEISFEYELTEEDLTEFNGYVKDVEKIRYGRKKCVRA